MLFVAEIFYSVFDIQNKKPGKNNFGIHGIQQYLEFAQAFLF